MPHHAPLFPPDEAHHRRHRQSTRAADVTRDEIGALVATLGEAVDQGRTPRAHAIAALRAADPSLTEHWAWLQLKAWQGARTRWATRPDTPMLRPVDPRTWQGQPIDLRAQQRAAREAS